MFLTELCPQSLLSVLHGNGRVSRGRSTGREGPSMPSNLELTKEILPATGGGATVMEDSPHLDRVLESPDQRKLPFPVRASLLVHEC